MSRTRLSDPIKLRGYLEYVLRDARTGEVVKRGKGKNTVVYGGRGWALAKLTAGSNTRVLSAIALGHSASALATSHTALASYDTIQTFNNGTTLSSSTTAACSFSGSVSFASNETWTNSSNLGIGEFALYNSSATASAEMFNRLTTSSNISFATSNTLAITITITN